MSPWADALACAKREWDQRRVVDAPTPFDRRCVVLAVALVGSVGLVGAGGGRRRRRRALQEALGVECFRIWIEFRVMQDTPENSRLVREGGCIICPSTACDVITRTMRLLRLLRLRPE